MCILGLDASQRWAHIGFLTVSPLIGLNSDFLRTLLNDESLAYDELRVLYVNQDQSKLSGTCTENSPLRNRFPGPRRFRDLVVSVSYVPAGASYFSCDHIMMKVGLVKMVVPLLGCTMSGYIQQPRRVPALR